MQSGLLENEDRVFHIGDVLGTCTEPTVNPCTFVMYKIMIRF